MGRPQGEARVDARNPPPPPRTWKIKAISLHMGALFLFITGLFLYMGTFFSMQGIFFLLIGGLLGAPIAPYGFQYYCIHVVSTVYNIISHYV